MDKETKQFQNDFLESVRQMKPGKATRETSIAVSAIAEVRYMAQGEYPADWGGDFGEWE